MVSETEWQTKTTKGETGMKDNRSRYGPTHYVVDGRTMTPETAEQHVAWLLYEGHTQTEIARRMEMGTSTVSY